ncbi:uncharacterized protein LOC128656091 [Bombina bombina]|uniref:uncharacterized protein LOC128656091 n=1 Tax=Bombina bombina TaxID=8345 RepID=UPI00235AE369|nr:uncharacterized protein LOC128656091 [Bombina bombina]XP_053565753.1 uncharacterized protein LOC128656091 [Bombina bombina]
MWSLRGMIATNLFVFVWVLLQKLPICDCNELSITNLTRSRRWSSSNIIRGWTGLWSSQDLHKDCLGKLTFNVGGKIEIFAEKHQDNLIGFWRVNQGNKVEWECKWVAWGKWTVGLVGEGVSVSTTFTNPIHTINGDNYNITKVIFEQQIGEGINWRVTAANFGGGIEVYLKIDQIKETTTFTPLIYSTLITTPKMKHYDNTPMCKGKSVVSSGPFQTSTIKPTPVLRDATFQFITWKIKIIDWLVSTHYQNCSRITATMEKALVKWAEGTRRRTRRDIMDTVLGGVGTGLGVVNSIDISSLTATLQSQGMLNAKGIHTQQMINTLVETLTQTVIQVQGPAIQHTEEILIGVISRLREVSWDFVCISMQTELSTDFKLIAQAMENNHTPLGGWEQSVVNSFASKHRELWLNSWLGCRENICRATSLVPTSGTYQNVYHLFSLGTPVTESHVLHHELEFPNFIWNGSHMEQVDMSGCIRFPSKILYLPNQARIIFDSCWHNHSYCNGFVEKVNPQDMIFPLGQGKVCFVALKPKDEVHVWFDRCNSREQITPGIYCITGYPVRISSLQFNFTVPQLLTYNATLGAPLITPILVDDAPWQKWVTLLQKDSVLLEHLKNFGERVHVNFYHQEEELQRIEHTFTEMSSATWWQKLANSFSKQSSWGSALGNLFIHPFIIILFISILCIIIQICMCCYLKSLIARVYHLYYGMRMEASLVH